MSRNHIITLRLDADEKALVEQYLHRNRIFDGVSALARAATLAFIGADATVHLRPVAKSDKSRPAFLWDYELDESGVRELLGRPGLPEPKRFLIERILAQARYDEVFRYLTVDDIRRALPKLRLPPKVRERWTYAIERWSR